MAQCRAGAHRETIGRPRRFGGCPTTAAAIALTLAAYSAAFADTGVECECSTTSPCCFEFAGNCIRVCAGFCRRARRLVFVWWEHASRLVNTGSEWRSGPELASTSRLDCEET